MTDLILGRIAARLERPVTCKFARPLILIPELFTTISHLLLLTGYLVSLGWEVYTIDLYAGREEAGASLTNLIERAEEAAHAAGGRAIAIGHGLGGLIALRLAETPSVGAGVALAPLLPGFASPLCATWRNRLASRIGRDLRPPTGRALFELVADADAFHRAALIGHLRPVPSRAAFEAMGGALKLASSSPNPRLIVTGDSDIFAPHDRVANLTQAIGAELATLKGRGHWLIGGRALEQLGQELLLLYPDETG
jgi:pimeloyl-ACP methyl ester carboxylesterase